MWTDANGNNYEDLPGVVEDTEARIVRLTFDETVTATTPVTIPISEMPATGIAVHETTIRADLTQTSAGDPSTLDFEVGTDDDPDAFASITGTTPAYVVDAIDSGEANVPLLTENDVAGAMHEVIQLALSATGGQGISVHGEVRILFSGRPASRRVRDSEGNIVAQPDSP